MDFFNSLPLDLKIIAIGIAGFALLALFSGNHKAEKRYLVVLALLGVAGVYRLNAVAKDDPADRSAATRVMAPTVKAPPKHKPLESTSAVK